MSNLWVFGDSYSADSKDWNSGQKYGAQSLDNTWYELLSKKLKVSNVLLHSQKGVANEWIYTEVITHQSSFDDGDYVIIQLTSQNRKWFLRDSPELSNIFYSQIHYNNKDEKKAVEYYKKYLHSDFMDILHYDMLVCALQFMAKTLQKKVKVLILPGFQPVPGITGTLGDVCNSEFSNFELQEKYYYHHRADPRINHMHEENHKILADKIYGFFKKYEHVDLTAGFVSKFINTNNYKEIQQIT